MHSFLALLMANITEKWKEIATDSNRLKCHALLAALHLNFHWKLLVSQRLSS